MRAALLRLFERVGEDQFSATDVCDEVERDGDDAILVDSVQRIGRKIAKGQTKFSRGKWCELEGDIECTYERGTFTVRRRPSKHERSPKFADDSEAMRNLMETRPGHLRTVGFLTVDWTGDRAIVRSIPAGNVPKALRDWADRMNADADHQVVQVMLPEPDDVKEHDWFEDARERGQVLEVKGGRARVRWEQISESVDWRSIADLRRNYTHMPGATGPTEPRVTQRHLDLMRHATGGRLRAVRNYSIAPPGSDAHPAWCELVAMGLAGEGEPPDCSEAGQRKGRVFHVTDAGFRMVYGDVRKPARKRAKR